MVPVRSIVLMFLLATTVALGQTKKPTNGPRPIIFRSTLVVTPPAQDGRIPFNGNFIPTIRVAPVEPVQIMWGGFRQQTSIRKSATDFSEYVREQISVLKREFKLDAKAVRRLQVASKGVLHRTEQTRKQSNPPPANLGDLVIVWNLQPIGNRTAEFRAQLHASKIWNGVLRKVLTKKQRTAWTDHHVFPERGIVKMLHLPSLPAEEVKPAR